MAYFVVSAHGRSAHRRSRGGVSLVAVVATAAAILVGVGVVTAPASGADDASTGTAGFFTPTSGRALDTNDDNTGPLQPGAVRVVGLGGTLKIPSTGVSAVAVTVTAVNSTGTAAGTVSVQKYGTTGTPATSQLTFNDHENVSNTAMVAVSTDVKIQVSVSTATRVLIDVQGWYGTGNGTIAPGGFVPNTAGGQRVADTRPATNLNVPAQTVPASGDLPIDLAGRAQVPPTATAVFANITVYSHDAGNGYITPYPTGNAVPTTSLNFAANEATSIGSVVDINSNEQFTVHVGTGNTAGVDIVIDIEGYFDDSDNKAAFTPASARIYDTTTSTTLQLAPNTTREVQVSNITGVVPAAVTDIGTLALQVTAISNDAATQNHVDIWGHDQAAPPVTSGIANNNLFGVTTRSNLSLVVPGTTSDTVFVRNVGPGALDVKFDVEGWYARAGNLPAANGANCAASGQRGTSHQIPHQVTDRASIAWNPVNGNLNLRVPLLHLAGAGQGIDFGLRYNSLNDYRPTFSAGWTESSITVNPVTNTATYTGADGACYVFGKKGSVTTPGAIADYNSPAYINATLTQKTTHSFTLRMNPSGTTYTYKDVDGANNPVSVWQLVSTTDSTSSNNIIYTYDAAYNRLASIYEANAPTRKLTFAYGDNRNKNQPTAITDTSLNRTVTATYSGPNGALKTLTDAAGNSLVFGYDATTNQMIKIIDNNTDNNLETNGPGHTTTITYDTAAPGRVATWTYAATGAATPSTFTASYPQGSQTTTTLTDPANHVTTFAFDSNTAASGRAPTGIGTAVVTITDPLGHPTNFEYNSHGDNKKTTNAKGEKTSSTYGANYLVNSSAAAGSGAGGTTAGATTFMNYPGEPSTAKDQDGGTVAACGPASAGALGNFRPCSGTDAQGHTNTYSYDSVSQNVTSVTTSGGAGGTQTNAYQGDDNATDCSAKKGQICNSTDGNNHITSYSYNTVGDLTKIDRPGNLGDIDMTFDAAGRITTRTDGNGRKSWFSYDNDDRPTQIVNTAATATSAACVYDATGSCVQYLYDHAGNLGIRGDNGGTTYYTYDQQNRLIEKQTKLGGTVTADSFATYDAVGNRVTNTDLTNEGNQTVTYGYDSANRPVWLAEPGTATCPTATTTPAAPTTGCVQFVYDDANRRTDTYLPNGRDNHADYDTNGRPTYLDNRPYGGNALGAAAGRSYAYATGPKQTSGPNSGQNGAGAVVSGTGTQSGIISTYYRYDGQNRLTNQGTTSGPIDTNSTAYWHYDKNGNRTRATTTGTGGTSTFATYRDDDTLCWTGPNGAGTPTCASPTTGSTGYAYDPAGNLTTVTAPTGQPTGNRTYGYSVWNQMTASSYDGTAANYGYADATSDERTQAGGDTIDNGISGVNYVTVGTKQIEYIRDPAGTLIEMRVKGVNPWATQYYSLDRLGSVILLTDSTGATTAQPTYDAWGVTTSAAPVNAIAALNRYGYASGYTDGTGLIKYGTRYYNPALGIWTQIDPAAKGSNHFIYAGGNPVTNADPSGRSTTTGEIEGCYFICLSFGIGRDDEGDWGASGGISVSTGKGVDFSLEESNGNYDDEGGVETDGTVSCSGGGFTGSGGFAGEGGETGGTVSGGVTTGEPGCEAGASWSGQFSD